MKVWTCIKFKGWYPVGSAAVVVASTAEAATNELNRELMLKGMRGDAKVEDMIELPTDAPAVRVLCDGNY